MPPQGPAPTIAARSTNTFPYVLALAALATLLFGLSFWWNTILQAEGVQKTALTLARTSLQKDVFYRRWNSRFGGVYVPVGPHSLPNPYLEVPKRDISCTSGRLLTLINPAYMTRQVHRLEARGGSKVLGHITSLKPIRPGNAPDPWERKALLAVEAGAKEYHQVVESDGKPMLRLLKPLYVEKSCLPCHHTQGYSVGQVRGGLTATVPLATMEEAESHEMIGLFISHLFLWAATLLAIFVTGAKLQQRIDERDQARQEVRTLSGLLPICSHCKKIRDDQGEWQVLESYIAHHSEADFSHGLCPDCVTKYYPEVAQRLKDKHKQ